MCVCVCVCVCALTRLARTMHDLNVTERGTLNFNISTHLGLLPHSQAVSRPATTASTALPLNR